METTKMGQLYEKIGEKLAETIPDTWNAIYLYGEVLEDSREVYFYYKSTSLNKLIYGHDIPEILNVDRKEYRKLLRELTKLIVELHNEYKFNNETVWSNLTYVVNERGEFTIKFNYDDIMNSPYSDRERQVIWEYIVMKVEPSNQEDQALIMKYVEGGR